MRMTSTENVRVNEEGECSVDMCMNEESSVGEESYEGKISEK
jgi:hypothetical protein